MPKEEKKTHFRIKNLETVTRPRYNIEKLKSDKKELRHFLSKNGLRKKQWDEKRNGPIAHRCSNDVYRILADARYERPLEWNNPDKYWCITIIAIDDKIGHVYVSCDELSGSQFDLLYAAKLCNSEGFDLRERILRWFDGENTAHDFINLLNTGSSLQNLGMSTKYIDEVAMFSSDRSTSHPTNSFKRQVAICRENEYNMYCAERVAFELTIRVNDEITIFNYLEDE